MAALRRSVRLPAPRSRPAGLFAVVVLGVAAWPAFAAEELPSIATKTAGLVPRDGFLRFYPDPAQGKVWLQLPPPDSGGVCASALYTEGIRTGIGSNDIGLDRGQLGEPRVVDFRRAGHRVLIEERNLRYRADSQNPSERRAVRESFATSVLWGGKIEAAGADGSALVDFTSFLMADAHGVARQLDEAKQGTYKLDEGRSAVLFAECLAFPDNVEFEALLTFGGSAKGEWIRSTVPHPDAVTLIQHHSLVRLPDPGYRPRAAHPRAGYFAVSYADYAAPLDRPLRKAFILRHRLEKTDPAQARSTVKKPIVFYVDSGAPEPVRTALREGVQWWARAFEEAGFVDAFRAEILPPDAHPLDVRYNVVQWVHRSTRGWSYGASVYDPRTGEILKGHVSLGSLRVRQDRLLFEGLAGVAQTGTGAAADPVQLALARIRQLAAHEVGHSLGMAHNFAASTYGGRASVMDYPAPLVTVDDAGALGFANAYGVGSGAWDAHAVRYGYSEFLPGADEAAELDRIVTDGAAKGYRFLSDADARPAGAAEASGSLWDNGDDAERDLARTLAVRAAALGRFGRMHLPVGEPLAHLEEVLAPVYFHHRYSLEAAVKLVGGRHYDHAVRGEGHEGIRFVDAGHQRRALATVLSILEPARLDLPDSVAALLLPRPPGSRRDREQFASGTAPAFDLLGAAATAGREVADGLLQAERMARLVDQHRRAPSWPGLGEVLDRLSDAAFDGRALPLRQAEIRRAVQSAVVGAWLERAREPDLTPGVRARLEAALRRLEERLEMDGGGDDAERAHRDFWAAELRRHRERPAEVAVAPEVAAAMPPGAPIGGAWREGLGGCSVEEF